MRKSAMTGEQGNEQESFGFRVTVKGKMDEAPGKYLRDEHLESLKAGRSLDHHEKCFGPPYHCLQHEFGSRERNRIVGPSAEARRGYAKASPDPFHPRQHQHPYSLQ